MRRSPGGIALVDRLAAAVRNRLDDEKAGGGDPTPELTAVDRSHPPTGYRIAFLDLIATPSEGVFPSALVGSADAELTPHFTRLGDEMLALMRDDAGM